MVVSQQERLPRGVGAPTARRLAAPVSLVGLAFAARMITLLAHGSGGLGGVYGYDAGVYYAASDSLLQGKLPYRDFVLLHPPGLSLVLTPFAELGRLTTDHTGYVVANLAFVVLGAANAGLVYGLARRLGAGAPVAWLGGAFYAVWYSAILAEVSLRLEPLGSFAALLGAFLLARADAGKRSVFAGGALVTFAVCVKIWWVVPVAVIAAVVLVTRRRLAMAYLAGTAATAAVVVLPFFLAAPGAMVRMVLLDQLGRGEAGATGRQRLGDLTSLSPAHVPGAAAAVGMVAVAAGLAVLLVRAARSPAGRVVAVVFVLQAATLLLSPTYFPFYGGYLAPVSAVLVAMSGVAATSRSTRRTVAPAAVAVVAAAVLTVSSVVLLRPFSVTFPRTALAGAVAGVRCVGTDSPIALIQLDVLTRNLRNGCPNWVDVTGRTYDVDASPAGATRPDNLRWQADILRYLRGNDVVLTIRPATGLSVETQRTIRSWPVAGSADGIVIRTVPQRRP